eukprot:NODE_140_length_2388_cov_83.671227_g122_i0.p1 GENE.NODE_140_length_2388_cov_83.671227_g122_i0~~NODE_140_length_2388_cov_83.671227_g122_i0.p1  ORF type:complete len:748 (+),score=178.66 NODE_140_length_2388_cov_83.671227_g122_i0:325-2244(+)
MHLQTYVGMWAMSFGFALQLYYRPYKFWAHNRLEDLSSGVIVMTLNLSLLYGFDLMKQADGAANLALTLFLLALHVFVMATFVYFMGKELSVYIKMIIDFVKARRAKKKNEEGDDTETETVCSEGTPPVPGESWVEEEARGVVEEPLALVSRAEEMPLEEVQSHVEEESETDVPSIPAPKLALPARPITANSSAHSSFLEPAQPVKNPLDGSSEFQNALTIRPNSANTEPGKDAPLVLQGYAVPEEAPPFSTSCRAICALSCTQRGFECPEDVLQSLPAQPDYFGLQTYTLKEVRMSSGALRGLIEALQMNPSLRSVSILDCGITDSAFRWICQLVVSSPSLINLDLSGNPLTDVSGAKLVLLIQNHSSLSNVVMQGSFMTRPIDTQIQQACAANRCPPPLHIEVPDFSAAQPTKPSPVEEEQPSSPTNLITLSSPNFKSFFQKSYAQTQHVAPDWDEVYVAKLVAAVELQHSRVTTPHPLRQFSARTAYEYYCAQHGLHPFQQDLARLSRRDGWFGAPEFNIPRTIAGASHIPLFEVLALHNNLHTIRYACGGVDEGLDWLIWLVNSHPTIRTIHVTECHPNDARVMLVCLLYAAQNNFHITQATLPPRLMPEREGLASALEQILHRNRARMQSEQGK